jgi:hypothetical protein
MYFTILMGSTIPHFLENVSPIQVHPGEEIFTNSALVTELGSKIHEFWRYEEVLGY